MYFRRFILAASSAAAAGLSLLFPTCLSLVTHEPPLPADITRDTASVQERWLDVRLNQFIAADTATFPMRFYYNPQFDNENGTSHIVIWVGGEWEISPGWIQTGLGFELAEHIQAGLFYTEHRFYGKTRPSSQTDVESLRYLTVDQALADLAQFIQYVKSDQFEDGRYKDGKVALVGCSYAGSMATWMRLAYPHLVDVAFSDSGPLHAQEDFPEYLEIISQALEEQGGASCLRGVQESMVELVELLNTSTGPQTVSNLFNTCTPLVATPLDLATFFWFGITETFAYMVQYATPGKIPEACAILNDTNPDPVQRLATWITSQPWTQPCIESRYTEVVSSHTDLSYDAPKSVMRLWTYQTCVEYGWYQTTTSSSQPFLSSVPLEYFHQMCKDFFGTQFNEEFLRYGIERTNTLFAGLSVLPDYVVSVQGQHDPWSPVGPAPDHATPLAPVHLVPLVSHCRAVRSTDDSESDEILQAKRAVLSFMSERITGEPMVFEEPPPDDSGHHVVGSVVLMILGVFVAM